MRITRFMLSLLVLRRLPGGGPLGLMFRLIAWGLIAIGAANVLKKALSLTEPPAVAGPETGWALPSEPIRTTSIQAPEGVATPPSFAEAAGAEAAVAAVQDAIVEAQEQEEAAAAVAAVEQAITEAQEEVDAAIQAVEQAIAEAQEQEEAAAAVTAVEQAIADAEEQEEAAATVAAVEQAIAAAQEKEEAAIALAASKRAKSASKAKQKVPAKRETEIPTDADGAISAYDPELDTVERPWIAAIDGKDCPGDFPIKAKASSMIFYGPQDGRYDRTHADVCFITEDAATEAGYRAPHTRKGSS